MRSNLDPDVYKEILGQPQKFFKTPPTYEPVALFLGKGLVVLEGEEWKKHRKMLTPLFHYGNLKGLIPLMSTIGNRFTHDLAKHQSQSHDSKFIKAWAMKINIAAIFGDSFDGDYLGDQFSQFVQVMADWITAYFIFGNLLMYIPISAERRRRSVTNAIKSQILQDLAKRRKSGESGADLISLLLKANTPDEIIVDEAITFLFAGYDTTSTLLVTF